MKTTFNSLGFRNSSDFIDNRANQYQKKMYNALVEIENCCSLGYTSVIMNKTSDIINIAINNSDLGLESMRSVVDYFLPKLRKGRLLDEIEKIHKAIHTEIDKRERAALSRAKKEDNSVPPAPLKAKEVKAPSEQFVKLNDEFPTFADASFPDTSVDIFSKMLTVS